jgi:hypothetical protein
LSILQCTYIGAHECSGAGGRLRCSNPNELVELAEVPMSEAWIVRVVWVLVEATPGRCG